jgi:hypothetical protein
MDSRLVRVRRQRKTMSRMHCGQVTPSPFPEKCRCGYASIGFIGDLLARATSAFNTIARAIFRRFRQVISTTDVIVTLRYEVLNVAEPHPELARNFDVILDKGCLDTFLFRSRSRGSLRFVRGMCLFHFPILCCGRGHCLSQSGLRRSSTGRLHVSSVVHRSMAPSAATE